MQMMAPQELLALDCNCGCLHAPFPEQVLYHRSPKHESCMYWQAPSVR